MGMTLALLAGVVLGAVALIVAAEIAVRTDDARDNPPPSFIAIGDEP